MTKTTMKIDRKTIENIDKIECKICKFMGVSQKSIINRDRCQLVSTTRAMIWYILHVDYNYSVRLLADIYFRKERAVFHQIAKMRDMINSFSLYKNMYENIKETL